MHLHGFNMYIIEQGGAGEAYNGSVVRPENPQRRDTFITAPYGYTVFQFDAGANPGIWPMHCHTAAHSATGMFLQFLSSPLRTAQYDIPDKMARQCQAWIETGIVPIGA
jgi:FtsP/CotA-like multicopper oxidase with cupredoxin domain